MAHEAIARSAETSAFFLLVTDMPRGQFAQLDASARAPLRCYRCTQSLAEPVNDRQVKRTALTSQRT